MTPFKFLNGIACRRAPAPIPFETDDGSIPGLFPTRGLPIRNLVLENALHKRPFLRQVKQGTEIRTLLTHPSGKIPEKITSAQLLRLLLPASL